MAPQTVSVEDVASIVRKQLRGKIRKGAEVTADSGLEDLGLSSLDVTEVFFAVEERVGIELDPVAAADARTLGELVAVINGLVDRAGDSRV